MIEALQIILIVLKMFNLINWPWVVVFWPIYVSLLIIFVSRGFSLMEEINRD